MNLLSLVFFIFLALSFLIYYVVPKKGQWIVLLAASLGFYLWATWAGLLVLVFETLVIYLLARVMEAKQDKAKTLLCGICILAGILMLLLLKYLPETIFTGDCASLFGPFLGNLLVPFGISYYTLMIISYAVDVYRQQIPAETNFARLLLFAFYFPSITQGPINRYGSLAPQLKEEHAFDSKRIFEGLIRFAWGAFKKLVVANRTAAFIAAVYAGKKATGVLVLLALLMTMLQLYSDFSGCADMAIGISNMFGIKLPENFRQPYYSRSIKEYWRRWHITLGTWLKDYIYMPMTMSRVTKKFVRAGKDRNDRKRRTKIASWVGLMVLWIVMGVWHGSGMMFFLMGVYYGIIFIITDMLEPVAVSFGKKHPKVVAHWLYKFWQQVRTTLLLWLAPILFSVKSFGQLGELVKKVFTKFQFLSLFDGTILKFDLDGVSLVMLLIGFLTMIVVSTIEYNRKERISSLVMKQKLPIRILIYWFVILMILLSLNVSNTEFIYAQF